MYNSFYNTCAIPVKEVVENSILNITLEEPLEENDEKNLGLIIDFRVQE